MKAWENFKKEEKKSYIYFESKKVRPLSLVWWFLKGLKYFVLVVCGAIFLYGYFDLLTKFREIFN